MLILKLLSQNAVKNLTLPRLIQSTCSQLHPTILPHYWSFSNRNLANNFGTSSYCFFDVAQTKVENTFLNQDVTFDDLRNKITKKNLSLDAVKQATVPGLTETDAIYLISLCGKPLRDKIFLKNKQALKIFEASSAKTVKLYNHLLQVYVENGKQFNSSSILNQMKELKLKPNEETYVKLVAGHCIAGDMNGAETILEFANKCGLQLPEDVKQYLAYGYCIAGFSSSGMNVVEQQVSAGSSLSWDIVSNLLMGLAKTKSFDHFEDAINRFCPCTAASCTIDHVLEIFFQLSKVGQRERILPLLNYLDVSSKDILCANEFLSDYLVTLSDSAYLLNSLFERCKNKFQLKHAHLVPVRVIMKDLARSQTTADQMFDKLTIVKSYYPKSQVLEYLTLAIIAKENPRLTSSFLKKLIENKFTLTKSPALILQLVGNHQLLKLISNAIALQTQASRIEACISNLKIALSSETLGSHALDVFTLPNAVVNDSSSSLSSEFVADVLVLYFEKYGLNNWSLRNFQALLHLLQRHGVEITNKDIQKRQLMVAPEADFLLDSKIVEDKMPINRRRQVWKSVKPSSNYFSRLVYDLNFRKDIDLHSVAHALSDFIVDEQYKNPDIFLKNLEVFKNRPNFHSLLLPAVNNFMYCFYLEHRKFDAAKSLMDNGFVDLNIQFFPSFLLKSKKHSAIKCLMSYLAEKHGYQKVMWLLFGSFVKANMFHEAQKLIKSSSSLSVRQDTWRNIFNILSDDPNFVEKVNVAALLYYKVENFSLKDLYFGAVQFLLQERRFVEAQNVASSSTFLKLCQNSKAHMANLFYIANQIPPKSILPKYHQHFLKVVQAEHVEAEQAFSLLKSMQSEYPVFWKSATRILLLELYKKIPFDDYDDVTEQVNTIFKSFKPNCVSGILTDHVQKLASNVSAAQALQFAKENLQESTDDNLCIWSLVFRICGDAALQAFDCDTLERLQDFSLDALPKIRAIGTSYILYYNLKSGKSISDVEDLPSEKMPLCVQELVSLITKNQDSDIIFQLYNISKSFSSTCFLENLLSALVTHHFDPQKVQAMFKEQNFSDQTMSEIVDLSYKSAASYKELRRIDCFFRSFQNTSLWLSKLNTKLFFNFSSSFKESGFDNEMTDYMVKMYHCVPSSENSLYSRTVYLDLLTNAKYGYAADNRLCVYY